MDREIKFRVWDKDTKYMHICGDDTHDTICFDDQNRAFYYNLQNGCGSSPEEDSEDDDYIFMQYTGKNAPNGYLFDGDIFEAGEGKVPTLVFWDNENSCWSVKNLRRNEIHRLDKHFQRFIGNIIGNICENKELLEP